MNQSKVPARPTTEMIEAENGITEITLQVDGSVYVFGLSRDVLEIIHGLNPDSEQINNLLRQVQAIDTKRQEL